MTKLLVVSGFKQNSVEVINLDESSPNVTCKNFPDLPFAINGGMGRLYEGDTPIVCGGFINEVDSCDCLSFKNGSWQVTSKLNSCRRFSGVATLSNVFGNFSEEMILIVGGRNEEQYFSNTESFDGREWKVGVVADLPRPAKQHCVVKINETTLMSMGGIDARNVKETYLYNSVDNKWTPGPSFATGRNGPSCGLLNWKNEETGNEEKVVVAASGASMRSVQLLFLEDYEAGWVEGPDLPMYSFIGQMVEYQNSVIVIGGDDDLYLYQLSSPEGPWIKMNQKVQNERNGHSAFLIPDELAECF